MKKKIVIALIALVVVLAAVVAALYVANKDVVAVETTEVITVTEELALDAAREETADAQSEEAEEAIEIVELHGVITEVTDEYIVLDAGEMGMIQANITDDTLVEGVDEMLVGQTAVIMYDGKRTRSIPAQITALHIGVHVVKGTVEEVADGRVTILQEETGTQAVLTLPQNAPALAVGDVITAYTTGVATMSLPPQMNALTIVK